MIDKYRLEDLRRESGEKGELARWVIQLQVELDRERRKGVDSAELQERSKADSNSHPAHGPLSNYRLHRISDILSKAAAQRDGGNIGYAMSDAVKAIDELLAGRKSEPDYIRYDCGCCGWETIEDWRDNDVCPKCNHKPMGKTELFIAPPAPVVPATLPCAVELKPGLIIGKGCKTETLLTALQRRADYYAEIDAMTPEERAEHDANIEAFKAMLPQPVPVVPEEATPKNIEMLASARVRNVTFQWGEDERNAAADSWNACRAAMLQGDKS
ncbi:hypothetical protein [Citrobacter koseri]|uniref:hypothetical protein n=1 Tax=Citrobacter koseri TaxID=545 RepID=UPI00294349E6|nr:hypothetical protein [Citrobacter koseri]MEB2702206.1 hypothetical protein [Citrobacter koseri]MEB2708649.1 hypothetical protein [Citrobacter koseri]MEB2771111.1 hypothetical protein [Citrobacter koseri]WOJ27591.1 hypothetical protein R1221_07090 [Citrobacter koseri]